MGWVRALVNTMINRKKIAGFCFQTNRHLQRAFPVHTKFYGTHGAHGCAAAAQRAFFFAPVNLPGQISCA